MPQLPTNYDNMWVTVIVVSLIILLVVAGYWRSRPIKKSYTAMPVPNYLKVPAGGVGQPAGQLHPRTIPPRPIIHDGQQANARPLREAPRRDDGDALAGLYSIHTLPADGHNPVHGGPHIGNDNHSNSSHDSSSSSSSGDSGSSGGGDGGGGGSD
jgi:uncharacterized membrane protein YgcG